MTDDKANLKANLARVQEKLSATDRVDPEVRNLLENLLEEIDRLVDGGDSTSSEGDTESHDTLAARLSEAARQFEDEHPTLSSAVGSVIDVLSRMGI